MDTPATYSRRNRNTSDTRPGKGSKVDAVHAELRQKILDGVWKVDDRLPTEAELAEEFACSPATINKAAALLVQSGLIERRQRMGMRVVSNVETAPVFAVGTSAAAAPAVQLDAFAMIYPSVRHEGIHRIVRGFQDEALRQVRRVVTLTTGTDYHKELEFVRRLAEFDVKGAVVVPLRPTMQAQLQFAQAIMNPPIPLVGAAANLSGSGCASVRVDNFHAGYTMTRHLIDSGARRTGFFSNRSWANYVRDRHQGYRWALREAGLEERADGVTLEQGMRIDFDDPLEEPTRMARVYLERVGPGGAAGQDGSVDAVVCGDDFLAFGMIRAALALGLRIPDDLRVTGIDDYLTIDPPGGIPLTTYHVPYETIGQRAFRLLEAQVAASNATPDVSLQSSPDTIPEELIAGSLVIRASG
ncbi:transcriptional regulator [Opitutaceae bacterium TAV5]|nr:transcriptional regulator [Opitutaceae bacterium TAV5]